MMWPIRFPKQGARLPAPSDPGGCLAPPPAPHDAGRARLGALAAGSGWGLPPLPAPSGSAAPSRRRLPCGALLPLLSVPCEERGAAVDPSPWMAPDCQRVFSLGGSIQVLLKYRQLLHFPGVKSMSLVLCRVGTTLSLCFCLYLEAHLKNYIYVDLPRRRQQTRHWDHSAASVQFLGLLAMLFMGLLLKRVGLRSIILW